MALLRILVPNYNTSVFR